MNTYILTVSVRFAVEVKDFNIAHELAEEKAIELCELIEYGMIGAFETEVGAIRLEPKT